MWIATLVAGVSIAGDMAAQGALTLRVHDHGGGGGAVSSVLLANAVPVLLCVPIAGYLADRVDSRKLLVVSGGLCAALCLGLASTSTRWLLLLLIGCVAAVSAVATATLGALVPLMAGRGGVVRANTQLRGAALISGIAGLALAGAGSQWLGTGPVLVMDAVSFIGLAIGALMIRTRRGAARVRSARWTRCVVDARPRTRVERFGPWTVTVSYALVLMLVSTTNVAQVFFVKDVLGANDLGYGAVAGCWTIGTAIALPLIRKVPSDASLLAWLTLAGEATVGVAILGCGILSTISGTVLMYVLGGVGTCVMQVSRGSYLQLTAPEERRGQQLASYNAVAKTASITALGVGGVLLDTLGPGQVYLLAGAGGVLAAALAAAVFKKLQPSALSSNLFPPRSPHTTL
ncbi:MAG TPA: MFS transporter [Pseudonocardia sp.]